MTVIQVRVLQERDASGRAVAAVWVLPVEQSMVKFAAGEASKMVIAFTPTRTSIPGLYTFDDPAHGAGRLQLEGFTSLAVARVDELVRLAEISRVIGEVDPIPGAELGPMSLAVMHNRSPFVQMLTGAAVLAFGGWLVSLLWSPKVDALPKYLILGAGSSVILLCGVWAVYMGARRLRWWLRARKQALSDGGPVSDDLRWWG